MKDIKINIAYNLRSGPYGGGNQFLKALKKEFIKRDLYDSNPKKANCLLFNSHHEFERILHLKYFYPNKIFIHRIDGPVFLIRNLDFKIDRKIFRFNNLISEGTIFQSKWSKMQNKDLGLPKNKFEEIIANASDKSIFFPKRQKEIKDWTKVKCKLIAVSWSKSINKGFDLYNYLDQNLNFQHYSMIFVGNSPIPFKNLKHIKPVNSYELANLLRESDIYITGSKNDPCSNALIEALSCGLPSVVLNDGGHPEILKEGGEVFNNLDECIKKIENVKNRYEYYRKKIEIPDLEQISLLYLEFIKNCFEFYSYNKNKQKKLRKVDYFSILIINKLLKISIIRKIRNRIQKKFPNLSVYPLRLNLNFLIDLNQD